MSHPTAWTPIPTTLAAVVTLALGGHGLAQEALPLLDRTLTADTNVQAFAHFGYTMAIGKLGGLDDTEDDVVVAARLEDDGGERNVGALYVFENQLLLPPAQNRRLLPSAPEANLTLGFQDVVIGNIRGNDPLTGQPMDNVILASAAGREALYPACNPNPTCGGDPDITGCLPNGGSVEIYDFNQPGFNGTPFSLTAPPNSAVPGECIPAEVSLFGYSIALGDVTRDGSDDLIVGANNTILGNDPRGRVYVFWGNPFILDTSAGLPLAWQNWVGLNPPIDGQGKGFGHYVAADNLDLDTAEELIISRPDKGDPAPALGGVVYVVRGKYVHDLFSNALNAVTRLPIPAELDANEPEYQRLDNPFGLAGDGACSGDPVCRTEGAQGVHDLFGHRVWAEGDVGSPGGGPPDGLRDVWVHSQLTDYLGDTGTLAEPEVCNAGGLFVYFGDPGTVEDPTFVNPDAVLLQRPPNVGTPTCNQQFGRAARRIELRNPITEAIEPALMVSDYNAKVDTLTQAGQVVLFRFPLCPTGCSDPTRAAGTLNAWADVLTEPIPGEGNTFGSWIVVGDYLGLESILGQQFLVSARRTHVTVGMTTYEDAGAAYSFTPAP